MGRERLNRVGAVAANTFREAVRERVLYNLVFFALLMILSGLFLWDLSIRQDDKIIADLGLAAMDIFGTLIAVFIGVGLLRKEIERRSLYPLLARPLGRGEFLVGKFAGLGFTLLVNVGIMTAGLYLTLWALRFRGSGIVVHLDLALIKGVVAIYFGLLLTVAVAIVFSVTTSSTMGAVSTVAVLIVGRYADVIRNMQDVLPGVPGWATSIIYYALPNFHHFEIKTRVVHDPSLPWTDVAWIAAYGAAYATALLVVASLVLRRKDL